MAKPYLLAASKRNKLRDIGAVEDISLHTETLQSGYILAKMYDKIC